LLRGYVVIEYVLGEEGSELIVQLHTLRLDIGEQHHV
jgi:hypothetical protein